MNYCVRLNFNTPIGDILSFAAVLLLATTNSAAGDILANTCPSFCTCVIENGHNLADCSDKHLIHPNVGVPDEVELLYLTHNDITLLDSTCFETYKYLINLTISYNSIHTIDLDVFRKLRRLRAVDLSYNRLEYLDSRLFESNRKLTTLNLEGNKFMSLPNKPLLYSSSLRTLNLASSLIDAAVTEHYSALPLLQELDLSHNLIITIDEFARNPPIQLQVLNLNENNLNCDHTLKLAIQLLEQRKITVAYSNCRLRSPQRGFELDRMVMASTEVSNIGGTGDLREASKDSTVNWHRPALTEEQEYHDYYDLEDGQPDNNFENFHKTNTPCMALCQEYLHKLGKVHNEDNSRAALYTQIDLLFTFLCGVVSGIGAIIFIGTCVLCILRCTDVRKAQLRANSEELTVLPMTYTHASPSRPMPDPAALPIPMPQRRVRNSRRAASTSHQQRALQRHDPGAGNFITGLFGRPARHQYYRTINENTATLIRRLSRSNLFNNRLSQHFTERNRDRGRQTDSPPSSAEARDDSSPLSEELAALSTGSDGSQRAKKPNQRPETPPPHYNEVIVQDSLNQ